MSSKDKCWPTSYLLSDSTTTLISKPHETKGTEGQHCQEHYLALLCSWLSQYSDVFPHYPPQCMSGNTTQEVFHHLLPHPPAGLGRFTINCHFLGVWPFGVWPFGITPNGLMCTTGTCITNPSQSHCFYQILRDYLWVAACWQVALCRVTGHLSVTETNYKCQYVMLKLLVWMWLQRGMPFSKHQLGTYSLQLVGYSKRRSYRVSIWGLTCNQSGRYGLTPCFPVGLSRG